MRTRLTPLLAALSIIMGTFVAAAPDSAANGCISHIGADGTAAHPFLIATEANLTCLKSNPPDYWTGMYFRQTADIDLTGTPWANGIGDISTPFTGHYDGNGHTITGLSISQPTSDYVGLFGFIQGATLTSITVGGDVTGKSSVGGLVGLAQVNSTISDCHSSVTVTTGAANANDDAVGGLVGYMITGTISTSSSTGSVSWNGIAANNSSGVGGLVGTASEATVTESWSTSPVSGQIAVGGLIGSQSYGLVERSYATGSVSGKGSTGGLVGKVYRSNPVANMVVDSYARGAVTNAGPSAVYRAGSLIGWSELNWEAVANAYGTGAVSGTGLLGGIVGETPATWSGAFWNITTTGLATAQGTGAVPGVSGKTTAQMTNISTFQAAGWSISNTAGSGATWGICPSINDGYPFLRAFYTVQPCTTSTPPAPPPTIFTLALDANGGSCSTNSVTGEANTWVTLPTAGSCIRNGFDFTGWATGSSGDGLTFAPGGQTLLTGDNTLYAIWRTSTPPATATPSVATQTAPAVITASISRSTAHPDRITLTGTITPVTPGQTVTIWFRTKGQRTYQPSTPIALTANGTFTWTYATARRFYAYATSGQTRTERVTVSRA